MQLPYPGCVPKNVQIRNLDDATYSKLRARAATDGLSLSQYLRRELDHLADLATMAEILARADKWREEGGGIPGDVLAAAHEADRSERR
jgi:plasmid stability protein